MDGEILETGMDAAEPMVFVVKGERFRATDDLPAWAMLKLAKGQTKKNPMHRLAAMHDFILAALVPDERERFEEFVEATTLTFEEINDAVGDLMVAYNGRPTERPSNSRSGQSRTGGPSRVVSLSQGTVKEAAPSSTDGEAAAS